MTRLVLLRHGRTAWNAEGRYQGHEQIPLDEVGRAQALAVAPVIASMSPVALWSSDLARAAETAAAVTAATGLATSSDTRLRERFTGAFSGLTAAEIRSRHGDVADALFGGGAALDVESEAQVAARMNGVLREVADAVGGHGTAVVVSHGWAIRMAVTSLIGAPAGALRGLENCGWAEVAQSGSRWHLLAWNRIAPGVDAAP